MTTQNSTVYEVVRAKFAKAPEDEAPVNTHDQIGHGGVAVTYRPHQFGTPARWAVWRHGYKTDPDAAWYDHGNKTFSDFDIRNHKDDPSLHEALVWASERYGIKRWMRNSMGDYVNADAGYYRLRN